MIISDKQNNAFSLKVGVGFVISSLLVKAVGYFTTPVFTRLMSVSEFGVSSTFIAWHSLLMVVFSLNLSYSIGRAKLDFPGQLDHFIGSVQLLSALVSGILCIAVLFFFELVSSFLNITDTGVILLLFYLYFEPAIIFYQSGCRYRYRYKLSMAVAWYIVLTTSLLSVVLIVFLPMDGAMGRMLGLTLPVVILSIILWINQLKKGYIKYNHQYWRYGWHLSGPLIVHTISIHILSQADRIFISNLCSPTDVGLYSLAYNFGMILSVASNSISEAWLPWFHDMYHAEKCDEIRRAIKPLIVFGCYLGLASIALAPEVIKLLGGEKYLDGIGCVPPIVLGIVYQFIYTHYVNIELHLKKTMYVSYGTIIAAAINLFLNAILIPQYGFVAAAYTTLTSYIFLMVIHYCITRWIIKIRLYSDKLMIGASVLMAICVACLSLTYQHNHIRYTLISIGFGSFILYFRDYIKNIVKRIRHRT